MNHLLQAAVRLRGDVRQLCRVPCLMPRLFFSRD